MYRLLIVTVFWCVSVSAQQPPSLAKETRRGVTLGLRLGLAIESYEGAPLGVEESDLQPPLGTVQFGYNPIFTALFQPLVNVGISRLRGAGRAIYVEAGGLLDWPKFHLSGGVEAFTTLDGGDYDDTLLDNRGYGSFIKGTFILGRWQPSIEFRRRQIERTTISSNESFETFLEHEGDRMIRPAVIFDLEFLKLWASYTRYEQGGSAIASRDFAVGLKGATFSIHSVGIGLPVSQAEIWFKVQHIEGVEDETANFYKGPQFYPNFLLAKDSIFLEGKWTF